MIRALGLTDNIWYQSTSDEETQEIQKKLGANKESIFELSNIPSQPRIEDIKYLPKTSGEASFVFFSRIVKKKNLKLVLRLIRNLTGKISLDIWGPIEDDNYWQECCEEIKLAPENIIIKYKGLLGHDEIHNTIVNYDAFVFPTLSENYGHVIAESLSSGCPIIVSNTTPWNNPQSMNAGWAISLADENEFIKCMQTIVDNSDKTQRSMRKGAIQYFAVMTDLENLKQDYKDAISRILSERGT